MLGSYAETTILNDIVSLSEEERVDLLKLMNDYHDEYYRNTGTSTISIYNHYFVPYSYELFNICYLCFSHRRLHYKKKLYKKKNI